MKLRQFPKYLEFLGSFVQTYLDVDLSGVTLDAGAGSDIRGGGGGGTEDAVSGIGNDEAPQLLEDAMKTTVRQAALDEGSSLPKRNPLSKFEKLLAQAQIGVRFVAEQVRIDWVMVQQRVEGVG